MGTMRIHRLLWVFCSTIALVSSAPKGPGENTAHANKDVDTLDEGRVDIQTTLSPSDLAVDLPENWDQAKDDTQSSLFLNKSDKNDLEPYPMALSDDAYDGQPIAANEEKPNPNAGNGALEHVLMRAELYGEPPSMARQPSRKKRAESSFRSNLSLGNSRVSKRGIKYSTVNRMKRETGMSSEDLLALLSLWEAQQHRTKKNTPSYYIPSSYYNQLDPYEESSVDNVDEDDKWLDEPVAPSHYSNYYPINSYGDRFSHYKYSQNYPEYIPEQPSYLQNLDALRRKRQWGNYGNKNYISKRFMVAKKRAEPNQYYYSQKAYRPREDLTTLSDLLKSSQSARDQGYPISRRMVL